MVRNTLVVLCLQILHRIVQEEVNEDRIDSVGFVWLFIDVSCLFGVLVLNVPDPVRLASGLDLRVPLLNFTLDQLHTPNTSSTKLDFPGRAWCQWLQATYMVFQWRRVSETSKLVQHLRDTVV